jgi:hypothetical protein
LRLAKRLKELTLLWQVGPINREIAHSKGIYSWDDPRCSSEALGIKVEKHAQIIDMMISMNRDEDSSTIISPLYIRNNMMNWRSPQPLDFYLDFESINDVFIEQNRAVGNRVGKQAVFMIGLGHVVE